MLTFTKEATTFKYLSEQASHSLLLRDAVQVAGASARGEGGAEGAPSENKNNISSARDQILDLGSSVGILCHQLSTNANANVPLDPHRPPLPKEQVETETFPATLEDHPFWSSSSVSSSSSSAKDEIYNSIGMVFWSLLLLSNICKIDLRESILKKMELNARKYPASMCKGRSGKYTEYSDETGITKLNQSLDDIEIPDNTDNADNTSTDTAPESEALSSPSSESSSSSSSSSSLSPRSVLLDPNADSGSVPGVMKLIQDFAMERNWSRYHTPRNIVLAMMGEVGELAEIFQWMGDYMYEHEHQHKTNDECDRNNELNVKDVDYDHIKQELADVAIYCLRLADVVGIKDLGYVAAAANQKQCRQTMRD